HQLKNPSALLRGFCFYIIHDLLYPSIFFLNLNILSCPQRNSSPAAKTAWFMSYPEYKAYNNKRPTEPAGRKDDQ
ncbi:hypothetical protein ACOZZ2_002331, partial [Cronobacter turicensis]